MIQADSTVSNLYLNSEERALRLAQECREGGECAGGQALCDEARISTVFAGTRGRLEKEHVVREARTRFHH